jgi:hypothetical protein
MKLKAILEKLDKKLTIRNYSKNTIANYYSTINGESVSA